MDMTIEYCNEKYSDPEEFLNALKMTIEPLGGGTEYDEEGELIDYEVALLAVDKAKNKVIKEACDWLREQGEMIGISFERDFIARFCKAMQNV